jgi:arginyl-tRNA synthetase
LKVDPKKTILFNPEKSIDFNGNTGPFIQYTYARIQSILKHSNVNPDIRMPEKLDSKEILIIKQLIIYPEIVEQALNSLSPAIISNYIFELVKRFNSFYQNVTILGAESISTKNFRLILLKNVAKNLNNSCGLLGIKLPKRM